jgi:hypothetical protein
MLHRGPIPDGLLVRHMCHDQFSPAQINDCVFAGNLADGGAAGSGGVAGLGVGGGLYNEDLVGAIAQADAQSKIKGNHASTSNDDIFG